MRLIFQWYSATALLQTDRVSAESCDVLISHAIINKDQIGDGVLRVASRTAVALVWPLGIQHSEVQYAVCRIVCLFGVGPLFEILAKYM